VAAINGAVTSLNSEVSGWDSALHQRAGNILLVDDSVQQLGYAALTIFLTQPDNTSCILKP